VGARPQFIKAAALSRVLRQKHREVLVHTGQHYDKNMSDVFFTEMDIPVPDHHLGIAGGTHGEMTGRMLIAVEEVILKEKPELLLVYGDTNSTVAAALAAVKLAVPVAHVEAGNRLGTLTNPEEVNRILTDHISSLLFACVESSMAKLEREGLAGHAYLTGDPMYDAFLYYREKSAQKEILLRSLDGKRREAPPEFYYMTCHRQENTDSEAPLIQILSAMNELDAPVVYPVHPRNRGMVEALSKKNGFPNIWFCEPVGYLESIALVSGAKRIVTDSGGVQREAFFAGVPCVTVLDFEVWPETMTGGMNQLARADKKEILDKLAVMPHRDAAYLPFGDGRACEKITEIITRNEGIRVK
jgi:UDP-N-acetylglucosamine 2-epimerase (non-hydrolysing)/UDP-GlcNAc3NAcA epimerase